MLKAKIIAIVTAGGVRISLLAFNGASSLQTTTNAVNYMNNSSKLMEKAEEIIKNDVSQISILTETISVLKTNIINEETMVSTLKSDLASAENQLRWAQSESAADVSEIAVYKIM